MHRMHHAYADTELDPHSPKYDSNLFKMMWRTRNTYSSIFHYTTNIDAKFAKDLPNGPGLIKWLPTLPSGSCG
jgi:stearoyl-CoA desaturase (delta-9 desaturase)